VEELPLYFSDGSVVTLAPAARARVDRTTSKGAVVVVEAGRLSANVVHRVESDWRFLAGPYSVHVTGTAFILTWRPAGVLDVDMQSGVVVVRGPGAESGVEVRDHHRFVVPSTASPADLHAPGVPSEEAVEQLAPRAAPEESTTTPIGSGDPTSANRQPPRTRTPAPEESGSLATENSPAASPSIAETDPPASWAALVARGEYSRVLGMAYHRGLDSTLASAGVEDLSALADAARFSGERGTAERTLREVRSRFSGTGRAQSAAFLLGRMADDAGDARAAVSWYERYSSEAPGGSLAAEALGRRMLALRGLNNLESARRAALEYLDRFPTGPHANIARDIAGR
jgi:TolA-binding protein